MKRHGRWRWLVGGFAASLLIMMIVFATSPWPSVAVIRILFDKGAADASAALEKHLPPDFRTQAGLIYDPQDKDARLDIYRPAQLKAGAPTIVWIHGGGFVSGRRQDIGNYLKILAGHGYVVVSIDYTIAPEAIYPQPVRQVTRALTYLDTHAGELGINREAFVLAGDSAGAQIAAQVANLITSADYSRQVDIAAPLRSTQLKGALLYCGVYDVSRLGTDKGGFTGWFLRTVTWAYSGRRHWQDAKGFELMSVADHVTPAFPATFISAGNTDPLEPQSVLMDKALRNRNVVVDSLFFPSTHKPALAHEYQFNLDTADGRLALDRSLLWLARL
jgi:acetyl esterase/lipase